MIDSHIHIGQFFDFYTSSVELTDFCRTVNICRCAVSSTTICEESYNKVLSELKEFIQLFGEKNVFPVLWVTPLMINDEKILKFFLNSGINWCCLKIHTELHPYSWTPLGSNMKKLIYLAKKLKLSILIHTGEMNYSKSGIFKKIIKKNYGVKFILAHGRPLYETINILQTCKNAYVDTAFMPIENIKLLCNKKLSDKILWGSDIPVQKYYYKNLNIVDYYFKLIKELKENLSDDDYNKITSENFFTVYKKF